MSVRVRMAPSPTGFLHIGGVRTFLFNWLFARGHGGKCLLRIENTDTNREVADSVAQIEESLRWLGIDWDGETRFQLDGADRCRVEASRLVEENKAYEDEGAIRIRMPNDGVVAWDDAIKGRIEFPADQLEDMVILRSDGRPVYNYASPVDDWVDGITHVIRGDDHVSNTPKQIVVLQALGAELPVYAHSPNIFGEDGKKLSKRHGAVSVGEFREAGYIAPALMNFLALLGWAPDGETTIMSPEELIERFTLERVGSSPATFDYAKLDWISGIYLRNLGRDAYADALVTYLREQGSEGLGRGTDPRGGTHRAGEDRTSGRVRRLRRLLLRGRRPGSGVARRERAHRGSRPSSRSSSRGMRRRSRPRSRLSASGSRRSRRRSTSRFASPSRARGSRRGCTRALELLGRDVALARLRHGAAIAG